MALSMFTTNPKGDENFTNMVNRRQVLFVNINANVKMLFDNKIEQLKFELDSIRNTNNDNNHGLHNNKDSDHNLLLNDV